MFVRIVLTLLWLLILSGCGDHQPLMLKQTINGHAFEAKIVPGGDASNSNRGLLKAAAAAFKDRLELIEGAESPLIRLNNERGPVKVPRELYDLLSSVVKLKEKTGDEWNPYLDKVRKLWGLGGPTPSCPHPDSLFKAVMEARNTRLILAEEDEVSLDGEGSIYLGRGVVGWALDQAAILLMEGGAEAGVVSADGAYRQWGKPSQDMHWFMQVDRLPDDSTQFRIESDDGGLCSIYLDDHENDNGIITEVIYPFDDRKREGLLNLTVWAPDAFQACIVAEAMYSMEREQILRWAEDLGTVGVFFVKSDEIGLFAESNSRMSPWVSSYLP